MKKVIIIRYGEIYLKGDNRNYFESLLIQNINYVLKGFDYSLKRIRGRFVISDFTEEDEIISRLSYVFGIYSYSLGYAVKSDLEIIQKTALNVVGNGKTFKVSTNRADKLFSLNSQEISAQVGGFILENIPNLKVDLVCFNINPILC